MLLRAVLLFCVPFLAGCSQSAPGETQAPRPTLADFEDKTVDYTLEDEQYSFPAITEFAGEKWVFKEAEYSIAYIGVVAYYTSLISDDRLLYCIFTPAKLQLDEFKKVQRIDPRDGIWIDHGPQWLLDRDGCASKSTYEWGELEGWQRMWYADGQLRHETHYIKGRREGEGRGFWPDGTKQWEATYVNNIEITGTAWNEKGEELR